MRKLRVGDKVRVLYKNTSKFNIGDIVEFVELSGGFPTHRFYCKKTKDDWCLDLEDFEILPKYEIGKQYEFSNNNEGFTTPERLVADLGSKEKYRYLTGEFCDGRFFGYKFIREIENPRIKEIEYILKQLEIKRVEVKDYFSDLNKEIYDLQNELKTLK